MEDNGGNVKLPPGFHFNPTDEELIVHFLYPKESLLPSHPILIPDLDLRSNYPWQLNGKALWSENQWYFFSPKTENRVTQNGYWNQLNIDEPIMMDTNDGKKIGIKKYFVFCIGEAPDGAETNWIMQEYHLSNRSLSSSPSYKRKANKKNDCSKWILCRVYERKGKSIWDLGNNEDYNEDDGTELSCLDEMFLSLDDDLGEVSLPN